MKCCDICGVASIRQWPHLVPGRTIDFLCRSLMCGSDFGQLMSAEKINAKILICFFLTLLNLFFVHATVTPLSPPTSVIKLFQTAKLVVRIHEYNHGPQKLAKTFPNFVHGLFRLLWRTIDMGIVLAHTAVHFPQLLNAD